MMSQTAAMLAAGYRGVDSWTTEHHLVKGERVSQERLLQLITEQRDKLFVASTMATDADIEADKGTSTVVGCICAEWAKEHRDLQLPDDNAMLGLFAVDPAFQSMGVGGALMAHAEEYIKSEWQCKRIVLWVIEQRDDIMQWYRRCGYVATGERLPFVMPDLALVEDMQFCVLAKDLL
jgi:ribosomal protein S18 acetylase RimI-like enzyme